jgi:lipopolysaccharide transport system permease protein
MSQARWLLRGCSPVGCRFWRMGSSSPEVLVAPRRRLRIDSLPRWFPDLGALLRYRHLIVLLGRRDITARYRQTVLGIVWIFAGPLVSAFLFSFVFGRVANLPSGGVPYFVFSYAGLLGWNLFSNTLSSASTSLVSNSGLITKIYFPRLVLPLSTLASTLLNTAISFGIMVILLLIYGIGFSFQLLLLPVWLLLAILLAMGIGLVLTACAVLYRDVNYLTGIFTSLLMYLSPVAYSIDAVPASLRHFYLFNPLTTIVEGCRWSLLGSTSLQVPFWAIAYTVALTFGVLMAALALFARLESSFADVI